MTAKVIAVVSTFEPSLEVVQRATEHVKLVDHLIIVDDGSRNASALNAIDMPTISVIRLPRNEGIAAALNAGMRDAIARGAELILTLDQDTTLDSDYVDRIRATFAAALPETRVGIVLTSQVNHQPALPPRYSPEGFGLVDEGIQSGMVISAACLNDIGDLDERLFIDGVDIEYCLRARDAGWAVALAPDTNISHSIGRLEPLRPFGIQRRTKGLPAVYQYHAPFRSYYIVRNTIDLLFRNVSKRPSWVLRAIKRESGPRFNVLTSGPHRLKHLLASIVGFLHGVLRRRGKIPNWLVRAVREP